MPEAIAFVTKPEIALAQIEAALRAGVPQGVVLMDAGYGTDTGLRTAITALGLPYVAGIQSTTTLWPADKGPLPPKPWSGRGRPTTRTRRDAEHQPAQAKAIALGLPTSAWQSGTPASTAGWPFRDRYAAFGPRVTGRTSPRGSVMKTSDAQWAPRGDPDDPETPISEAERERFRKGVAVLLKKLRKRTPQAPAPLSEPRFLRKS